MNTNTGETKMCEEKQPRTKDLGIFVKDWDKVEDQPFETCILCGKDTSKQKVHYYTLGDGSPYLATHVEDKELAKLSAGYMGVYPIGSTCAKRIIDAGYGDYIHTKKVILEVK